jgi:ABC-2 type transport system ATP-binding protein
VIRAEGLSRAFGGRQAVADVSFHVDAGEVVGFLGPNGAGKTTTMRMLLGLLRPDAGRVGLTRPVGYLPEVFPSYEALSVRGYLRFLARVKRVAESEIERAADAAGVGDLLRRPVSRLSRGQRQRVGIAQALLGRPPAYVLDEPTQGLDPKQVVEARRLIRSLATEEGGAVLLSTHVLSEVAVMCDRVVVIAKGRIVGQERPGEASDLEERFLRLIGEAELS